MKVLPVVVLLVTFAGAHILGNILSSAGRGHAHNQYPYPNGAHGVGGGNYPTDGNQYPVTSCRMCPYGWPCTYVRPSLSYCGQEQNYNQCYQPMDSGHCPSNYYTRYYYDHYSQVCRSFRYSGCGGNANRFHSLRECRRTCEYPRGGGGRARGGGGGGGRGGRGGRGWGGRGGGRRGMGRGGRG